MPPTECLIEARWIVPVVPDGAVYENHALLVRDGRIQDLLSIPDARVRYANVERIALVHHALIPGLVNAHTHAAMTLFRGLGADQPLEIWLKDYIWPLEAAWVDRDFVRDGTRLAITEMLLSGTTCFNDMYFHPDATIEAAIAAGIRLVSGIIVLDLPTRFAQNAQEYLHKGFAIRDGYRHESRIHFTLAPHAPYTVGETTLRKVARFADELGLRVHMHVHETEREVQAFKEQHGCSPIQYLERLGLLTPGLLAVHVTTLDAADLERLARARSSVIHCPESNLKLGSGFCPVADLRAAGVQVALGTDGAASNDDLDLLGEMRSAALLAKGVTRDPSRLTARDVLRMATLDSASVLGLEEEIGSLERGKAADCVAIDLSAPATIPCYNPVAQIVYAAGRQQVSHVWIEGQLKVREGRLLDGTESTLAERVNDWRERILDRLGVDSSTPDPAPLAGRR
ncbi:chlorohydrolase/deaminase family protein [mine drainage metagenome]|uniref:Chlorohydrolase/deaminase family protein n=3 Tax=mine drainage metagenome TaxID=410659 RepID=T1B985_9ZZZZ